MSVTLEVSGGGEYFIYPELFAKCDEFHIIELLSIICDHGIREPKSADDVILQKTCTFYLGLLG